MLSLVQSVIYLYLIGRAHWTESASEFLLGKIMLAHSMMSSKVFVTFIMIEFFFLHMLSKVLLSLNALGNGLTVNEYANAKNYKYLFHVEKVRKSFDDFTVRHGHQEISAGRFFANPFIFFFNCARKPLR